MAPTNNNSKRPQLSKKWLYGSLAVIALIIGVVMDKEAVAAESDSAVDTVEQVEIDNANDEVEIDTSMQNDDFEADDSEDDMED